MVICKFFLQGNCKFGDYCKFDHQLGDNFNTIQNQNSVSILRQSHFTPSQPAKPTNPTNVDTNTLVKSVVNDMTVAEKGGQWLLSCYAPFKEKPGFAGFEDQSFEEIRWGYYEAVRTGSVEQYKQQIQIMLQQAVLKLKSLQAPSPDIVNILKSIYNTPPSSHAGVFGNNSTTTNNAFNNPTGGSLLGQAHLSGGGPQPGPSIFAQTNQSLFGNSAQSQYASTPPNIFGNATQNANIFGGQTTNSPFSNSQPQNPGKSIFSQVNANLGNQTGNSIFVGHQPGMQTTTGPIFGSGQPNSSSIFGGPQASAPFTTQQVQPNSGNIFIKPTNPPFDANNAFGTQNNSGPFSQANPNSNIFRTPLGAQINQPFVSSSVQPAVDKQAQNQLYGTVTGQPGGVTGTFPQQNQYQNPNSLFAQRTQIASDAQSHSSNIFGNNQLTKNLNLPLEHSQQIDESIYSKLEDLTEDEIKWFESDDLDILNIPEKPPTYEMCFKR